jgi:hypothetical protein
MQVLPQCHRKKGERSRGAGYSDGDVIPDSYSHSMVPGGLLVTS